MFHGLTHENIYAAARLTSVFELRNGETKEFPGTAFGVACPDGELAIITNRHLVELNYNTPYRSEYCGFKLKHLICEIRGRNSDDGFPGIIKTLTVPMSHNEVWFDDNRANDVAVIFDVQSYNSDGSNDRHWDYCFELSKLATENELYSDLHPFDLLAFTGFPSGFDKSELRAIIRSGTVASDPRFSYTYDGEDKGEIILYEGFSFGGSSGSPVIAVPKIAPKDVEFSLPHLNQDRRFLVVGINAGHTLDTSHIATIPQHSGLSYFVKSSVIRRILDKCIQKKKNNNKDEINKQA